MDGRGSIYCSMFLPATARLRESGLIVLWSWVPYDIVTNVRKANVVLYCLPPHTTHVLQPLDVSVFSAVKKTWAKILKEFKTTVHDAAVTKQVFPSLLNRLWQESMRPDYLVSGFRATGLHPLNRGTIKDELEELQTALNFQSHLHSNETCNPTAHLLATPITRKVTSIFTKHFQAKQLAKKPSRDRIKPGYYGQSITSDDALSILQQREEERKLRTEKKDQARTKRGKSKRTTTKEADYHHPENTCQGCKGHYDNDEPEDQECWVGCDNRECWRRFHYWCAGLTQLPDPNSHWSCPSCLYSSDIHQSTQTLTCTPTQR